MVIPFGETPNLGFQMIFQKANSPDQFHTNLSWALITKNKIKLDSVGKDGFECWTKHVGIEMEGFVFQVLIYRRGGILSPLSSWVKMHSFLKDHIFITWGPATWLTYAKIHMQKYCQHQYIIPYVELGTSPSKRIFL